MELLQEIKESDVSALLERDHRDCRGVIGQAGSGDRTYQKEETAGAGCIGSPVAWLV